MRFLIAKPKTAAPVWWFGGGFDLTPFYVQPEDVLHWHRTAQAACTPFGANVYLYGTLPILLALAAVLLSR